MTRLVAVLLVLAGCGDAPAPAADPSESPFGEVAAVDVRPGISLDRLLAASADASGLVRQLDAPRQLRAEAVPGRQADSLRTWIYDGLELAVYEVADGRSVVQRLTVTSGMYGTSDGVSVGETRDNIERALGQARSRDGAVSTYTASDSSPTTVEVTYEPDPDGELRASLIEWRPRTE